MSYVRTLVHRLAKAEAARRQHARGDGRHGNKVCLPDCQCGRHGKGRSNFSGGDTAALYAKILCPLFTREHHVYYGRKYILELKIDIELDGPCHDSSKDAARDGILRAKGWSVVRVQHNDLEVRLDEIRLLVAEHPQLRLSLQLHKLLKVQ